MIELPKWKPVADEPDRAKTERFEVGLDGDFRLFVSCYRYWHIVHCNVAMMRDETDPQDACRNAPHVMLPRMRKALAALEAMVENSSGPIGGSGVLDQAAAQAAPAGSEVSVPRRMERLLFEVNARRKDRIDHKAADDRAVRVAEERLESAILAKLSGAEGAQIGAPHAGQDPIEVLIGDYLVVLGAADKRPDVSITPLEQLAR